MLWRFRAARFAERSERSILFATVARKRPYRAITSIDPAELAAFQAAIRRRYSDEEILDELRASAERLGRSPTMKEFAADPATRVHPQTVIEHFGTWNKAKRLAGLVPRRYATREELLGLLQELGRRLGRVPTARDVDANRSWMPSKSLVLAHVRIPDERAPRGRLRRAGGGGAARAGDRAGGASSPAASGACPSSRTGREARRRDPSLLTEWQVYRMFDARKGAWSTFQYLIRERLREEGVPVARDGRLGRQRRIIC